MPDVDVAAQVPAIGEIGDQVLAIPRDRVAVSEKVPRDDRRLRLILPQGGRAEVREHQQGGQRHEKEQHSPALSIHYSSPLSRRLV